MQLMQKKFKLFSLLSAAALILAACGTFEVGVEATPVKANSAPTALASATASPELSPTPQPPTATPTLEPSATPTPNPLWVEYRDTEAGFGFALPCWWQIYAPTAGALGATTIASYDEAFFMANSIKGWWIGGDYPPGAIKIDFIPWGGIDPAASNIEAARQALTNDIDEVTYADERMLGSNPVVLAGQTNRDNPSNSAAVYVFRLTPERVLLFAPTPPDSLTSPDIKGIVESLVLSNDQPVVLPSFAPSTPLIDLPDTCPAGVAP